MSDVCGLAAKTGTGWWCHSFGTHTQPTEHTNTISCLSAALNGNRPYIKETSRDFITSRAARTAPSTG